jgi:DNA-binding CsgD family transcriptional regulator
MGGRVEVCDGARRAVDRYTVDEHCHAEPMGTSGHNGSMVGQVASGAAAPASAPTREIGLRLVDGGALDPIVQPQCSLGVQSRRANGPIIGRAAELEAIGQELREARSRLAAVTLEGEPGIGKTRLLISAAEMAIDAGFTCVAITADEEIRGPFLLARSLFAAPPLGEVASGTPAELAVRRVVDAISGRDEPGYETLSADAKLLRAFDLGGIAIGALAQVRPLALLIDDVQWADDDTLRLLRYVVRADASSPIFLFLTIRPDEFSQVTEAVNFVADMERMGLVRRLRPGRFSSVETGELVKRVLGGPVDPASAAAMHTQSEGVPFIVEELARTHREAGTLQLLDGQWRLGRNAARLVPSAVRTLISRRAARLPADTRAAMADAAVLGRSFSLKDLRAVQAKVGVAPTGGAPAGSAGGNGRAAGDGASEPLAEALAPAVQAGLLLPHPAGDAADYTFTHEQVREFALNQLSTARARQVHAAVVDLLLEGGDPAPEGLPMLAQHALAAGDTERAARFSIQAATSALESSAPEEALRLVEQALPVVSSPQDRRLLLATRDDAYAALRRPSERLEGLTELASLAEALRDPAMELDVQLRRAAALRNGHDEDAAAELARRVRARGAERGDKALELRATLELGQALMKSAVGESFGTSGLEVDAKGGQEAYEHVVALAEELGDEVALAAALRELATIELSKAREWFGGEVKAGRVLPIMKRISAGETLDEILPSLPIAQNIFTAIADLERALAIYERRNDRNGVMSTIIAIAYTTYAPTIHLTSSARHLEEIRRVTSRRNELITESERARQELQMLYGIHVYARAKVVPDLMLTRGIDAHRAARIQGDRGIEFLAAGGIALAHLQFGDIAEAERWLGLAAGVLSAAPSRIRARQLETWRGQVRAAAGDAEGLRQHLEAAVTIGTEHGRAPARCEALARLAIEAARLGARQSNDELLDLAKRSAEQAIELSAQLPGHPSWGSRANAALATVALARGQVSDAVTAAATALQALEDGLHEDLDLEIFLPAARALFAGAPPEATAQLRAFLEVTLARIAQGTLDEDIRVRWLRGPVGRELSELVGPTATPDLEPNEPTAAAAAEAGGPNLDDLDRRILHHLTAGLSNREMAADLGIPEEDVAAHLGQLLARLGASNRTEATLLAFRGLAPVGAG